MEAKVEFGSEWYNGSVMRVLRSAFHFASYSSLAVIGILVGGFILFATYVGEMQAPADPASADAIIVLTGGQARIDTAMDLLRSGKGKRLLISGVHPSAGADQLRRAIGGDRETFNCCVDIDRAALDTIGNAQESAKWIRQHGYDRVIVVTNNYHMPRSLLEMRRLTDNVSLVSYPVINRDLHGGRWLVEPDALRVLATEYLKYLAALGRPILPDALLPARLVGRQLEKPATKTADTPARQPVVAMR